jgi:hypothetical protein
MSFTSSLAALAGGSIDVSEDNSNIVVHSMQDVADSIEEAKKDAYPPIENLWLNIYKDGLGAKLRGMEMGRPKIQLPQGSAK